MYDDYDSDYSFKVTMPYYFIDGYNGMDYSTIRKFKKEKRSSGQMHHNDLIYLAKVSEDYKVVFYETLAFVKSVMNSNSNDDYNPIQSYDYEESLLDHIKNIKILRPTFKLDIKCTQMMNHSEANKLYGEMRRMKGRHWICIHIMSFGGAQKEYDALYSSKLSFLKNVIMTGQYNNKENIISYIGNDSIVHKATSEIVKKYKLNNSEAFVLDNVWNKKLSIVHSPPGSGKMNTIVVLIRRQLYVYLRKGKLTKILICAPSNFACDKIYDTLILGNFFSYNVKRIINN